MVVRPNKEKNASLTQHWALTWSALVIEVVTRLYASQCRDTLLIG